MAAGSHQGAVVEMLMAQQFVTASGECGQGVFDFGLMKQAVSWNFASFFMTNSYPHPMMAAVSVIDIDMVNRLLQYGCPVMVSFQKSIVVVSQYLMSSCVVRDVSANPSPPYKPTIAQCWLGLSPPPVVQNHCLMCCFHTQVGVVHCDTHFPRTDWIAGVSACVLLCGSN